MLIRNSRNAPAFTLVELLTTVAIAVMLLALLSGFFAKTVDAAKYAHCVSNLRTLAVGAVNYAQDRNGYFWSKNEIGNSRFRAYDDPMGLPVLMKEYLPNESVWWCKAGRPSLKEFRVNYVWAVSTALSGGGTEDKPASPMTLHNPRTTILFWDNYSYMQPSISGVPDGGTSTGPPAASTAYRRMPHVNGKRANQVYMDGHVVFEGNNN